MIDGTRCEFWHMDSTYIFPKFWYYPPYFTVQPIAETFEKQKRLWSRLILDWCKSTRTFLIDVHDDRVRVFSNKEIERHLDLWEKRVFLDALCEEGKGQWLDDRKDVCLVMWKSIDAWADDIYAWCKRSGETVILVDDLVDVEQGCDVYGLPLNDIIMPALEVLEGRRQVKRFNPKSDTKAVGIKIL